MKQSFEVCLQIIRVNLGSKIKSDCFFVFRLLEDKTMYLESGYLNQPSTILMICDRNMQKLTHVSICKNVTVIILCIGTPKNNYFFRCPNTDKPLK